MSDVSEMPRSVIVLKREAEWKPSLANFRSYARILRVSPARLKQMRGVGPYLQYTEDNSSVEGLRELKVMLEKIRTSLRYNHTIRCVPSDVRLRPRPRANDNNWGETVVRPTTPS